jgi:hypothetical protein
MSVNTEGLRIAPRPPQGPTRGPLKSELLVSFNWPDTLFASCTRGLNDESSNITATN